MSVLSIACPQCSFSLFVTNHQILGRPARCPSCGTKFLLRDPSIAGDPSATDAPHSLDEETLPSHELRVDMGRAYVTMEQLQRWHSQEESSSFLQWIANQNTNLAAGGMGFFLDDYEQWQRLGKPTSRSHYDESNELCVGASCIIRKPSSLRDSA